jgi:hypothetical protein
LGDGSIAVGPWMNDGRKAGWKSARRPSLLLIERSTFVSKRQPPSETEQKKATKPVLSEMELQPGPVVNVGIHAAPPAPPAEKTIHARRRLPEVPDAPSPPARPKPSGK